jgi:hypothetical protein
MRITWAEASTRPPRGPRCSCHQAKLIRGGRCAAIDATAKQLRPIRVKIHRSTGKPPTADLPPKADVPSNVATRRICASKRHCSPLFRAANDAASGQVLCHKHHRSKRAIRNCTRDGGRPFGLGGYVADPPPPQVLRSITVAVRKRRDDDPWAGTVETGECMRTVSEASKRLSDVTTVRLGVIS